MQRSELEHVIRAAGAIADDTEIIIIGSQSILGQFPDAPLSLLASMEAAVFPRHAHARSDAIDGSIGEGSAFHELYGYYAQGVGPKTATLPSGWERRLIRVLNPNTNGVTGLCLEVHDLAISKYVAAREKDLEFTLELAKHHMTRRLTLLARLRTTKVRKTIYTLIEARIARDFAA